MAPPTGIIYQDLIQKNCQTFLNSHAEVDVVSQLDKTGQWTVHVLRTEYGKRSAILQATGSSLQEAFEELHKKSALALDQFVSGGGFERVPDAWSSRSHRGRKKGRGKRRGSFCSVSTAQSEESDSGSSGDGSDSDANFSIDFALGRRTGSRSKPPAPHKVARGDQKPPPSVPASSPNAGVIPRHPGPPPYPQPQPIGMGGPPAGPRSAGIPPPPGLRTRPGMPPQMASVPASIFPGPGAIGSNNMVPVPPGARQPIQPLCNPIPSFPQQPASSMPRMPRQYPVLLQVFWFGHGQAVMMDECVLSKRVIQFKALEIIRNNSSEFLNATPADLRGVLIATVKHLVIGDDGNTPFLLANSPDDLSKLYDKTKPLMRFFVQVHSPRTNPPRIDEGWSSSDATLDD